MYISVTQSSRSFSILCIRALALLTYVISSFAAGDPIWNADALNTGDVVGISGRSGGTPFLVQAVSGSPLDHVAIAMREGDALWFYQFTNNGGARRISYDFSKQSISPDGVLRFAITRPELTDGEIKALKNGLPRLIAQQVKSEQLLTKDLPLPAKSCTQFVRAAFELAGIRLGKMDDTESTNINAFDGFARKLWREILPGQTHLITPVSILEQLPLVATNLELGKLKWTEREMLHAWEAHGDASKISRIYHVVMKEDGKTPSSADFLARMRRALEARTCFDIIKKMGQLEKITLKLLQTKVYFFQS